MHIRSSNLDSLKGSEILLVSPHPTPPVMPYAGLGYLASKIRSLGLSLEMADLGVELMNWFTEPSRLEIALKTFENKNVEIFARFGGKLRDIAIADLAKEVHTSLSAFRKPYHDGEAHELACSIIAGVYKLYEKEGSGLVSPPGRYASPWAEKYSLKEIQEQLLESSDIFKDFTNHIARLILRHSYRLIGLSICHGDQLLPALGFAKSLRKNGYDGIIACGGVQISFLHNHILETPSFFEYVDWYVPKKGELFFEDVAMWLKGSRKTEDISNLTFLSKKGSVVYTKGYKDPPYRSILAPDFEGLPLDNYLVPSPTFPIQTTSRCYWGRCNFCIVGGNHLTERFDRMESQQVFDHMIQLYEKFGCKNFFFADDSSPVDMLTGISQKIIDNKLPFKWQSMGNIPESSMTNEVLNIWAQGGCTLISLGVETGSRRMLKVLNKKHSINDLERILVDCKNLKIMTHCFTFYGHPLEEKEDLIETMEFKRKYEHIATHFTPAFWRLTPFSMDYKNIDKLGVVVEPFKHFAYGLAFPALRFTSDKKTEIKKFLDGLIVQYKHTEKPRSYLGDWVQYGHGTHISYAWAEKITTIDYF